MSGRRSIRHVVLIVGSALVGLVGLVASPGVAEAHTSFDYSLPTDGASVGVPIGEITVAFTSPVTLVGNGFAVLDPQNNELAPFAVTDDDTVFRLQFDPPLVGGTVAVKYEVRAEDGHVLTGNFVFDVDAPVPTTVAPTTAPTAAPTTVPPTTPVAEAATTTPAAPTTVAGSTLAGSAPAATTVASTTPASDGDGDDAASDDGGTNMMIVIAVVVALAAGGFLLVRSRTST